MSHLTELDASLGPHSESDELSEKSQAGSISADDWDSGLQSLEEPLTPRHAKSPTLGDMLNDLSFMKDGSSSSGGGGRSSRYHSSGSSERVALMHGVRSIGDGEFTGATLSSDDLSEDMSEIEIRGGEEVVMGNSSSPRGKQPIPARASASAILGRTSPKPSVPPLKLTSTSTSTLTTTTTTTTNGELENRVVPTRPVSVNAGGGGVTTRVTLADLRAQLEGDESSSERRMSVNDLMKLWQEEDRRSKIEREMEKQIERELQRGRMRQKEQEERRKSFTRARSESVGLDSRRSGSTTPRQNSTSGSGYIPQFSVAMQSPRLKTETPLLPHPSVSSVSPSSSSSMGSSSSTEFTEADLLRPMRKQVKQELQKMEALIGTSSSSTTTAATNSQPQFETVLPQMIALAKEVIAAARSAKEASKQDWRKRELIAAGKQVGTKVMEYGNCVKAAAAAAASNSSSSSSSPGTSTEAKKKAAECLEAVRDLLDLLGKGSGHIMGYKQPKKSPNMSSPSLTSSTTTSDATTTKAAAGSTTPRAKSMLITGKFGGADTNTTPTPASPSSFVPPKIPQIQGLSATPSSTSSISTSSSTPQPSISPRPHSMILPTTSTSGGNLHGPTTAGKVLLKVQMRKATFGQFLSNNDGNATNVNAFSEQLKAIVAHAKRLSSELPTHHAQILQDCRVFVKVASEYMRLLNTNALDANKTPRTYSRMRRKYVPNIFENLILYFIVFYT